MSERNKPNGACHDEAETPIENPATARWRRYLERKAKGILVLRNVDVGPEAFNGLRSELVK